MTSKRSVLSRFIPVLLLPVLLASCGDDPAAPADGGHTVFSRLMGGTGQDFARDVLVTPGGLRVVAGGFRNVLHVTGSSDSLISAGSADVFLSAFRSDGSVAWLRGIGGAGEEVPFAIARDVGDNLYIAGYYNGDTVFGGTNLTGHGFGDALVARLDANGNPVWVAGGGAAGMDMVLDVIVAPNGEVIVCGVASSEIALAGEDIGEFGSTSGFLVTIRSNGVGIWAATASGTGSAACLDVERLDDGSLFVCGEYGGSNVTIGGETLEVDGNNDGFIASYTHDGVPAGAIRIGGSGEISPVRMTRYNGDLVVVGNFSGTADFDMNTAAGEVTSPGGSDAFVARYGTDGALRWARAFGTANDEIGLDVCPIGASDLLVCGSFDNSLTLGSTTLDSGGSFDYFMARIDGAGNVRSASRLGGPNSDVEAAVTSVGSIAIIVGRASGGEFTFPDGSRRNVSGTLDGFIYQR